MRTLRSIAAWVALALLFFGPVIVSGFLPSAFLPSLALWFVVFTVVPAVADVRAGRPARRGYGRYEDLSDLPGHNFRDGGDF